MLVHIFIFLVDLRLYIFKYNPAISREYNVIKMHRPHHRLKTIRDDRIREIKLQLQLEKFLLEDLVVPWKDESMGQTGCCLAIVWGARNGCYVWFVLVMKFVCCLEYAVRYWFILVLEYAGVEGICGVGWHCIMQVYFNSRHFCFSLFHF